MGVGWGLPYVRERARGHKLSCSWLRRGDKGAVYRPQAGGLAGSMQPMMPGVGPRP